MVKVPHRWDSSPPPPAKTAHAVPILHIWNLYIYALMGIGLIYGLHTEHPGPIITNGMGPVIE